MEQSLQKTIQQVTLQAKKQSSSRDAQMAYNAWALQGVSSALSEAQKKEMFICETAFAGIARHVLKEHLQGLPWLKDCFIHVYESAEFGWFDPESLLEDFSKKIKDAHIAKQESPLHLLVWLYQFSLPESIRKQIGAFYTPPSLVIGMFSNLDFEGHHILENIKLIDPACGAGAFLIEATKQLIFEAQKQNYTAAQTAQIVQSSIYGLDINPMGILLTEAAIALLISPYILEAVEDEPTWQLEKLHLHTLNTLSQQEVENSLGKDSYFDFIIANPPYAKVPSRLLSESQVQRFSKTVYGHPNLYGLFLQVGVEMLKPAGRMCYITPKSYVSGLYFRHLRSFLKEKLDIEGFDTFTSRTGLFDGVLQEVVIITASKKAPQRKQIRLREFSGPPNKRPVSEISAPSKAVLLPQSFEHSFFVAADSLAHRLLENILSDSACLKEAGYRVFTGTVVWNRLKDQLLEAAEKDSAPLMWASSIRRFSFEGPGNRQGQASHLKVTDKTKGILSQGGSVFVKRLTSKEENRRIVACPLPKGFQNAFFAENHVNVIQAQSSPQISLDALVGILNSMLFDYVFRSLNGNTQVSASELSMLHFKKGPQIKEIESTVQRIYKEGESPKLSAKLDRAVCLLYGVSDEDFKQLQAFYASKIKIQGS